MVSSLSLLALLAVHEGLSLHPSPFMLAHLTPSCLHRSSAIFHLSLRAFSVLPTHAKLCWDCVSNKGLFSFLIFPSLPLFFFLSTSLSFFSLSSPALLFSPFLLLPFLISFFQTPELRGTEKPTMCWHCAEQCSPLLPIPAVFVASSQRAGG